MTDIIHCLITDSYKKKKNITYRGAFLLDLFVDPIWQVEKCEFGLNQYY